MKIDKVLKRFFWIPFIIGFYGYLRSGEIDTLHSIYASAALYFINPVTDIDNSIILWAKILALLVTAGAIISIAKVFLENLHRFFVRCNKGAVVVYSEPDNSNADLLMNSVKKGYLVTDPKRAEHVNTHILLFDDDRKTLELYIKNKKDFDNGNVYMVFKQIDPFQLGNTAENNVHYINIYDVMARKFWKEHALYDEVQLGKSLQIAFLDYDAVSSSLFKYAYLNNVYASDQQINYHIWGCNKENKAFLSDLSTMSRDTITIHEGYWDENLSIICDADYLFVTGENVIAKIQTVLKRSKNTVIYCVDEGDVIYEMVMSNKRIETFGNLNNVLLEESIINETLDKNAKLFCYDYELRLSKEQSSENYMEKAESCWKKLNGFYRGSNIARADHYWIEKKLLEDGKSTDEVQRVEHIRWCRYYLYNGWTYDSVRDNLAKKHNFLVPYDELDDHEKSKDDIYDPQIRAIIDAEVL